MSVFMHEGKGRRCEWNCNWHETGV